jgi:subtilisin
MKGRLMVGAALFVTVMAATPGAASPSALAKGPRQPCGAKVGHVYSHALRGYSATLPTDRVAALKADPSVAAVTPDLPVHAFAQTLPTGIDRIDGELSSTVSGNGSGAVIVDIAIIDTGIASHPGLDVVGGVNCIGGSSFNDDNGHGTHVAGIAAARDDAAAWSASRPGRACGRSRCWTPPAPAPPRRSSAASTGSPPGPAPSRSRT